MILDHLIQKRSSIENPAIPITDPQIWSRLGGGSQADSGMTINVESLLSYSPIWCGVKMLAQDIAQVPLYVYRRIDGGKERDLGHPASVILRRQANADMTANTWKQVVMTHALLYGVSYSWIVRDNAGRPTEVLPVAPERVRTYRMRNGILRYRLSFGDRNDLPQHQDLLARDVFIIRGMTMDGLGGLSLIEFARNSVGRGLAAEKYSNRFFRNNARPGGVLVHPNKLDDVAYNNLRDSVSQQTQGLDNAHKFLILEEGMQWVQTGISPEDSQLIESLEFGVKDASRVLGVPAHRLGDDSKTSFASLEQENLSYQESSLGPWYEKFQEEAYAKFLDKSEQERDSHTIEFQRNKILQADAKTRHEVYAIGLNWGFYSRDEVRNWENMNPLPDGAGEEFFAPLNMSIAGQTDEDQESENTEDTDMEDDDDRSNEPHVEALRNLMDDASRRASCRLAHYLERSTTSAATFCGELDRLSRHEPIVQDMFAPVVEAIKTSGFPCPSAEELSVRFVRMWFRAMDGLAKTCNEESLAPAVQEVIKSLTKGGVKVLPEGSFDGS